MRAALQLDRALVERASQLELFREIAHWEPPQGRSAKKRRSRLSPPDDNFDADSSTRNSSRRAVVVGCNFVAESMHSDNSLPIPPSRIGLSASLFPMRRRSLNHTISV